MVFERVNVRTVISATLTPRSFYAGWKTKKVVDWETNDVLNWVGSLQKLSEEQREQLCSQFRTSAINGKTLRSAEFQEIVFSFFTAVPMAGFFLKQELASLLSGTDFLRTQAPTHYYAHSRTHPPTHRPT